MIGKHDIADPLRPHESYIIYDAIEEGAAYEFLHERRGLARLPEVSRCTLIQGVTT